MKKIIGIFALTAIASTSFAAGGQDKDYAIAVIKLDNCCKTLKVNQVIFAKVDKDPMENYKKVIEASKDTKDPKYVHVQWAWNRIFETVTGNFVWALQEGRPFTTNTNEGKFWLVTRAFGTDKENYCWSIPINLKKGKTVTVVLNEKNRVSNKKLEKIFDKAVNKK